MKKLVSVCLSLALVCTLWQTPIFGSSKSVSDLQQQQQTITQNQKNTQGELDNTLEAIKQLQAEIDVLDAALLEAAEELAVIEQSLAETMDLLAQTELDLAQAQEDRDNQFEALKSRLRVMYEYGPSAGLLEVLFRATSFYDFLTRLDYVNSVAQRDRQRLERMQAAEVRVNEKLEDVNRQKNSIESLQYMQTMKLQALEVLLGEKQAYMDRLDADADRYEAKLNQLAQDEKNVKAAIQKAQAEEEARRKAAQQAAQQTAVKYNGKMLWPAPSYTRISDTYRKRINPVNKKAEFHTGVDLAAPMGSNVLAADAGKVIVAAYQGGYGNVVIIDHGGGISTLYAHNSKLVVSVGQSVKKGDIIAKIGSTGVSTGPHCHFEVRINGSHTDPKPYLGY